MTLRLLVLIILAIAIFNFAGIGQGWYWTIWWYDIPLHLAGGALVALLFFYLFREKWHIFDFREHPFAAFILAMGFVALIGVLWELFEYGVDVIVLAKHSFPSAQPSLADTMGDFVNDLLGGTVLFLIWRNRN